MGVGGGWFAHSYVCCRDVTAFTTPLSDLTGVTWYDTKVRASLLPALCQEGVTQRPAERAVLGEFGNVFQSFSSIFNSSLTSYLHHVHNEPYNPSPELQHCYARVKWGKCIKVLRFLLLDVWGGGVGFHSAPPPVAEWNLFDDMAREMETWRVPCCRDIWSMTKKGTVFFRREIRCGIFYDDMARTRSLGGFCPLICLVTFPSRSKMLFLNSCMWHHRTGSTLPHRQFNNQNKSHRAIVQAEGTWVVCFCACGLVSLFHSQAVSRFTAVTQS